VKRYLSERCPHRPKKEGTQNSGTSTNINVGRDTCRKQFLGGTSLTAEIGARGAPSQKIPREEHSCAKEGGLTYCRFTSMGWPSREIGAGAKGREGRDWVTNTIEEGKECGKGGGCTS